MRIQEIMSKPAATCRAGDTLDVAARLMWENDCGFIPVTNDEGKLAGVVTDRDVCMAAYTKGAPLHGIGVEQAMAKQPATCRVDDSLETAERVMKDRQIRRLPVVDEQSRPVGVVSLNDLARHAASVPKGDGEEHALVQTLAAISRPRAARFYATA